MKGAGCAAFGCAGVLAVAVLALLAVAGLRARLDQGAGPRPAPVDPDRYLPKVGALHRFSRVEEADRYLLSYGFVDHHGHGHMVTCAIGRADHARERDSFGLDEDALQRQTNVALEALVREQIAARRLEPYFRFATEGRRYHWSWQVPGGQEPNERARAIAESKRLAGWIQTDLPGRLRAIKAELYAQRGLRVTGNRLSIDYDGLIRRGTEPLGGCFGALARAGAGYTRRQHLGLFLAFFQELAYEIPPDRERGRRTLGLWVPTEVMVRGRGDCDSKSVAFCSMWRRFASRALFILLPRHALVAVEAKPRPGEHFVRLGNRYFVLCEVAGPAKPHPGRKPVSGAYEYLLVEPLSAADAEPGSS
jgi:hypothetical protein